MGACLRVRVFLLACGVLALALAAAPTHAAAQEPGEAQIINGSAVDDATYASRWHFFAQLEQANGAWWGCGGSLITPRVVLTAAHCVEDQPDPAAYQVRLGSKDRGAGGTVHTVTAVTEHPEYVSASFENDVALLTLGTDSTATAVALAGASDSTRWGAGAGVAEGDAATGPWVGGFGRRADGSYPTVLENVSVPIVPDVACSGGTPGYGADFFPGLMVCAGQTAAGGAQDTCQGDSGGPITVGTGGGAAGSWRLVGVTSWGIGCADDYYGVYARVAQDPICSWIVAAAGIAAPAGGCLAAPSPPANDAIANAQVISGAAATVGGTNLAATNEAQEPVILGGVRPRSVWYRWTAPAAGTVTVDTCSTSPAFDMVIGVFEGSQVGALSAVASDDDACGAAGGASRATFLATAGTTYSIAVANFGAGPGASFTLTLAQEAVATTPTGGDPVATPVQPPNEVAVVRQLLGSATVSWTAPTSGPAPNFYRVYRTGPDGRTLVASTTMLAQELRGLKLSTRYRVEVSSVDVEGTESAPSPAVAFTSLADKVRPSAPPNAKAAVRTRSSIQFRWGAARDARGIARYLVYRKDGRRLRLVGRAAPGRRMITLRKLRPNRAYTVVIKAVDRSGNVGPGRAVTGRTRR